MIGPRIIAGKFKGSKLSVPSVSRPFTDRVKQSVFDLIVDYITDAKALDIFAGSGNLGIESLSRGSKHVTFVDGSRESQQVILSNLQRLKILESEYNLSTFDFDKFIRKNTEQFDLIFIDPPFDFFEKLKIHKILPLMHSDTLVVLKAPLHFDLTLPESLNLVYEKKFGVNRVFFIKRT